AHERPHGRVPAPLRGDDRGALQRIHAGARRHSRHRLARRRRRAHGPPALPRAGRRRARGSRPHRLDREPGGGGARGARLPAAGGNGLVKRTMRSVQVHRYGPAEDVLTLVEDTPVPEPAPDEILVEAHATSVNPVDCSARAGYGRNIFSTLWGGLPLILGRDVSGVVVAVGRDVEAFAPGDEVYAAPHIGCYAEYVTVKAAHAA